MNNELIENIRSAKLHSDDRDFDRLLSSADVAGNPKAFRVIFNLVEDINVLKEWVEKLIKAQQSDTSQERECVYELVYLNWDECYFTIGMFKTADEALDAIKAADSAGEMLSYDGEESESIEVVRYNFGVSDKLRTCELELYRSELESGIDDDAIWKTESINVKNGNPIYAEYALDILASPKEKAQ